jgi:hypothetical protein
MKNGFGRFFLASKYRPHKEYVRRLVVKLLKTTNVTVAFGQKTRNRSDNADRGVTSCGQYEVIHVFLLFGTLAE